MWNSFATLFGKKQAIKTTDAVLEQLDKYGIPLLTETSPRSEPSSNCKLPLWDHQKAMLARCKKIEENPRYAKPIIVNDSQYSLDNSTGMRNLPTITSSPIGVMNDPPGCGKTYAILALLAESKGQNIIIVPQNIFFQWKEAIQRMFPPATSAVKCKFVNSYEDIMSMYRTVHHLSNPLKEYTVILMNDVFADMFAKSVNDTKAEIERLIIDEIDSVQNRMHTPIHAKHIWLVSASFVHQDGIAVGPYLIESKDIANVFCRCDPRFVEKSIHLEPPTTETIVCEDAEIQMFKGITSEASITALHAGDVRALLKEMGKAVPVERYTLKELAELYVKDNQKLDKEIETYKEWIQDERAKLEENPTDFETHEVIRKRIVEFKEKLAATEEKQKMRNLLESRIASLTPSAPENLKWSKYKEICKRVLDDTSKKWIICNDSAAAVNRAMDMLKEMGGKCVMLDGGSAPAIQKAITQYKSGEAQVLFINSRLEAVGMNLENTSNLLFMHATSPQLVQQVVGRAQRFGRDGSLHIIGLFNADEQADL
jgi:DNA polymerase III delta prime subunit